MTRYVMRFAIANVVLTILLAIVAGILKLESGSGLAVGAALASSILAASAFAKDHGRAPTAAEKGSFAWWALVATWLISLVLVAAYLAVLVPAGETRAFLRAVTSGSMAAFMAGAVVVISLIYYAGIRWSFGWYAKLAAERGR